MNCRIAELREKEVISITDGGRIGFIGDVEFDTQNAEMKSIVIYGRLRLFGLLGRERDVVIPWSGVRLIGDDTILVEFTPPAELQQKSTLKKLLEHLGLS